MPNPHERFTALYNTYQARVYGYAASRAGHQLAEEVVSETFLVAWRRLDSTPTTRSCHGSSASLATFCATTSGRPPGANLWKPN
ncbi:sigma factor [Nonomuraea sp. NPDC049152]|uniref:RNA polymerase sigma factor n=1 Tax=Nonomuraea sp. NPDC049152 TaxID=3154350 RepID=UPI0033ED3163